MSHPGPHSPRTVLEARRPVRPQRRGPWASLVNQVAVLNGVEITLLSSVVIDDSFRVNGALRVTGDHEPILASVPALVLTPAGDPCSLRTLGARALPQPPIVWLAWMFELTGPEPRAFMARIEVLELGRRVGRKADIVVGPWLFEGISGHDDGLGAIRRLVPIEP